jgi:hypothetical protein
MPMSPEARALISAAKRGSERPSKEARDRVRRKVLGAVTAGVGTLGATGAAGTAAASGTAGTVAGSTIAASAVVKTGLLTKIAAGLAIVVSVGGTAVIVGNRGEDAAPSTVVTSSTEQPAPPVAETTSSLPLTNEARRDPEPIAMNTAAPDQVAPSSKPIPSSRREAPAVATVEVASADTLPEEHKLLKSAQAALGRGDAKGALSLADDHATRFPKGALSFERRALRAVALCALGRKVEGRAEAQPIIDRAPDAPLAARVGDACK